MTPDEKLQIEPCFAALPYMTEQAENGHYWTLWKESAEQQEAELAAFMVNATTDNELHRLLSVIFNLSPYLAQHSIRHPAIVRDIWETGTDTMLQSIYVAIEGYDISSNTQMQLMEFLRKLKIRLALLCAFADILAKWPLEKVTHSLSLFAEKSLTCVINFLLLNAHKNGEITLLHPRENPSKDTGLIILGMGKLGGYELNYSSDIDLIILYEQETLEYKGRHNEQRFYTKLAHDVVHIMQERTSMGYVFRTDLRLRPDPSSTPPAVSVNAAMSYYESVGQNWERAAMIKARPVAGDIECGKRYLEMLSPFMWRRALDFASIRDILSIKRQMNAKMEKEIILPDHNIKIGYGGIREIEFYAQIYQLIWGGRMPDLRTTGTCETLIALAENELIEQEKAQTLIESYQYLRILEHRLQMVDDQQTHTMPETMPELENIAHFMGIENYDQLNIKTIDTLYRVHNIFTDAFSENEPLSHEGSLVFTGTNHDPYTLKTLERMGYTNPTFIANIVMGWHHGSRRCTKTKRARQLLTELMPMLLSRLAETANPDAAFLKFDEFLSRVPAGVQLFSLFNAHPHLLALIADIMGSAPALAETLSRHPSLMESVLFGGFYEALADRGMLQEEVDELLAYTRDYEDKLEMLRRFKNEKQFQAGVQLLRGLCDARSCGVFLTHLADVSIKACYDSVKKEFSDSYGDMPGGSFCMLGMGRLGSEELSFGSDIDIVLIYDVDDESATSDGNKEFSPSVYYNRFAQRLMNAFSALGREGRLYEVDARLRPFGNEGLTASSLPAFQKYFTETAWTFELMAMTRARTIVGDAGLMGTVTDFCREQIRKKRHEQNLAIDVRNMRYRVLREFGADDSWDIKYARGGLMELDFICQYLVLLHAHKHPEITARSSAELLSQLLALGIISQETATELSNANYFLIQLLNMLRLCFQDKVNEDVAMPGLKKLLCDSVGAEDFTALKEQLLMVENTVRKHYMHIIGDAADTELV